MQVTRLYNAANGFFPLILSVCIIALRLTEMKSTGDYIILVILIIIFFLWLEDFFKTKSFSFDERNIYLEKFKAKETVPFEKVRLIKRSNSNFRHFTRYYSYTIYYADETGTEKSCRFYLAFTKFQLWESFKSKLLNANPAIEIIE